VKEWLKLVYLYQSYRKNKSGVPLILDRSVYYRDFKMWVKCHSRSLKVVPFESFISNYGRICSYFGDIRHQRMSWPRNPGLGSL